SFEKVLVQNIQFGLSPSLTEAIRSIPRWRLIQAAFPHVMHCAATLLHNRRDTNLVNLGAAETKLLYTLHWIILDAAEECADADFEKGIIHSSPFYYLFSIPSISLFVYLFAPICHHLKESDFQTFRLENGLKIWQALWDYRHPETSCFTAHCKPKPRTLWEQMSRSPQPQFGDVFLGSKKPGAEEFGFSDSPPCQSGVNGSDSVFMSRTEGSRQLPDDESNWLSSPKETVFPETIPEESSSTEEEHVVIFRLPSLPELREINDETFMQQQPKRRSNSLPIPKIEVSIYQSPELKKRESKDFIEVPEDYHSLDTGDEHISRPCSALAKIFEPKSDQSEKIKPCSNLVKGKSMPSL
ncbi:hypothetical protein J437_LFUL005958, partial [Ladona fulva]